MSIKKYKPEQIVAVLRQIEVQIANGKTAPQACSAGDFIVWASVKSGAGTTQNIYISWECR